MPHHYKPCMYCKTHIIAPSVIPRLTRTDVKPLSHRAPFCEIVFAAHGLLYCFYFNSLQTSIAFFSFLNYAAVLARPQFPPHTHTHNHSVILFGLGSTLFSICPSFDNTCLTAVGWYFDGRSMTIFAQFMFTALTWNSEVICLLKVNSVTVCANTCWALVTKDEKLSFSQHSASFCQRPLHIH